MSLPQPDKLAKSGAAQKTISRPECKEEGQPQLSAHRAASRDTEAIWYGGELGQDEM